MVGEILNLVVSDQSTATLFSNTKTYHNSHKPLLQEIVFLSHTRDIAVGKIKTGQVQKKLYFLHVINPLFRYVLEFLWEMKKTDSEFDKFNKLYLL